MSNDNRKVGSTFERNLCISLSGYGFWCHCMKQNQQGQPFDVIAARDGHTYPIDAKVCEKDVFRLDRIEENQASAMTLWRECGNGDGWFALQLKNGEVYFISFAVLQALDHKKSLNAEQIKLYGIPLREWVGE